MKIALAQCNPTVGDTEGNVRILEETLAASAVHSPDLVVFSELFLTGYPPRDLLERDWFLRRVDRSLERIIEISERHPQTGIILGAPQTTDAGPGRGLSNAALLIQNGRLLFSQAKSLLPSYDVFDEGRYFDPAPAVDVVRFGGHVLGISICEDAWNDPDLWPRRYYPVDPQALLAAKGATVLINISASPFHIGKEAVRAKIFQNHAGKHHVPFVSVNQVGGNDELVFDGRSMCFDGDRRPLAVLPPFREEVRTVDIDRPPLSHAIYQAQDEIESLHGALVLGLRDYVRKCGFSSVVLGLSGGVDSAVVCSLAVEAIGAGNVMGVAMPGPYSSSGSLRDARALAHNLGIGFTEVPITPVYRSYGEALSGHLPPDGGIGVTLENLQARIRGNILMALSNEYGHLVLSTGNKSELAVGYCTLYGDMSGGLAVISDVSKTLVYRLAAYINRSAPLIPEETLTKPPSAELRPDQQDRDTLPPYEVLDPILQRYVDENDSIEGIVGLGFDPAIVKWVVRTVDRNEYKRRQAAPGLRVTPKAFGSGRRMPIAARLCG
ncbi:NAD+ synthase [Methanofollis fontis]|uniref:Glutamine-dependent NAD(+) synthetase n=1 Tax=Methanofollis fontis TaxID=2052832 RepID=A0A483CVD7_9EURY|nr:NAD+ synthase [Methanofollis fontis]TAJ45461.1 NAD+ synthase [Methanofollis fontis]